MVEGRELNVRDLLELERQIYQESIDRVQQQQRQLQDGVLEDFVRRCRPFEADRERELHVAHAQLKLSQRDALSLQQFDLQLAEDVFQTDREQLKRKLLDQLRRRRLKIQRRLETSNVRVGRPRREVVAADANKNRFELKLLETQLRRAQRRTRRNFNFRHLTGGVLPTPERIVNDVVTECEKLQRNREREEAAKMAEEEGAAMTAHVSVKEGRLVCRKEDEEETFAVGDAVELVSKLTEEDFQGFVSAVSSEEVQLVLVCGSHVKVTLARLRSEQCTLRKQKEVVGVHLTRGDGQKEQVAEVDIPGVATNREELLRDPPDVRRRAAVVMNRLKRKTTIDIRRGF